MISSTWSNPVTPVINGTFKAVAGFLADHGFDQFKTIGQRAEAQRNHHLKFGVASALRLALGESTKVSGHRRLFEEWDWMLERGTKEPAWLDQLMPGSVLETALGSANEYAGRDGAEPPVSPLAQVRVGARACGPSHHGPRGLHVRPG